VRLCTCAIHRGDRGGARRGEEGIDDSSSSAFGDVDDQVVRTG
jgi:hypothetical protein